MGQGERERRSGEGGLGLGEMGGRIDKESGDTGQEEEASWVTKDSLLGEAVTEGETVPGAVGEMADTGMVMG